LAFVATKKRQVAFFHRAKSHLLCLLFHDFGGNTAQEIQSEIFTYMNNKLAEIKTLKQAISWLCPWQQQLMQRLHRL